MIDFNNMQTAPPKQGGFKPSSLQQAIFDIVGNHPEINLIVEAVAGSGKTTTIVKACGYIPSTDSTLFIAFNKSIQLELQARLPRHVEALTFHSFGLRAIRSGLGKQPKVNFRKVSDLMDEVFGKGAFSKKFGDKIAIDKLIGFAKGNGHYWDAGYPENEEWLELVDHHDLNFEVDVSAYLKKITEVYILSLEWKDEIDFNDMLLHPVFYNYEFSTYDNIIVDEAQDLNSLQHEIVRRARISDQSRVIAVGDTHQAIYGFRGADSSSMGNLQEMFKMQELPLNVSYRCSKAIRDLAQEYVHHFESLPDAPEGEVETVFELPNPASVELDCLVLCRLNAPLFKYGMQFLNKGVKVQLWTNLDTTLKMKIKQFKAKSTVAWRQQLKVWFEREVEQAQVDEKYNRVQTLRDIFDTLMALSENTTSPQAIIRNLEDLVGSKQGPILSTIHKAKGHEARTCMIIQYNKMPSKWAKKPWMMNQEHNLIYVAITRAKLNLILHTDERD